MFYWKQEEMSYTILMTPMLKAVFTLKKQRRNDSLFSPVKVSKYHTLLSKIRKIQNYELRAAKR